jgi:proteasome lid subunit RPN8/RPN11
MESLPIIEGRIKLSLLELIRGEAPNEAVGIIYNEMVYPLTNISMSPEDHFAVNLVELRELVHTLKIHFDRVDDEVVLWHSHPSGGVGPSRVDMHHKTPLKHHLVVSLVDDDLVPTWY